MKYPHNELRPVVKKLKSMERTNAQMSLHRTINAIVVRFFNRKIITIT